MKYDGINWMGWLIIITILSFILFVYLMWFGKWGIPIFIGVVIGGIIIGANKEEKDKKFEKTQTYKAVSQLYETKIGKKPMYAIMPEVVISGPKLSRDYNTNWFATRVDGRYQTCMQKAKRLKT